MKYPRYPAYKPSRTSWLGEIPQDWEVHRLKWSVAGCDNGIWGEEPDGSDDDIVCLRVADFDRTSFCVNTERLTIRSVEVKQRASRQIQRGDLLIEKSGGGEKQLVGCVVHFDHEFPAVCSNFVARMPVAEGQSSRFWVYAHAALYAGRLNEPAIKQTTGIQNLDAGEYLNNLLPYPSLPEQEHIAAFLDWKTAQIDALIAKKHDLIEKLKEKRLAVITHAVTKGLDPKVVMKDSTIPWAPRIPKHWVSGNIRRFTRMKTGHTPSRSEPSYWLDCDISWFTLADVWQLRDGKQVYLGEAREKISKLGLNNSAAELLPKGTVIFSRTASVGYSGIMPRPMATSQDYWNWVPESLLVSEYLLLQFRAMGQEFQRMTMGSTHKTIYQPDAASLRVCVPPLSEQEAIVEFVFHSNKRVDAMLEKVQKAIEHLTEYRTTLITAAVTGQIDVRHITIPTPA